ncbi:MAG: hypothetical protein H0T53_12840, partial [Herpetosiphonaceae bacterium]|nr:hypothetical protein [Herpetosiphonaceae bacterium]
MRRCLRLAAVLLMLIAAGSRPFSAQSADPASRYFAQTGHTVQGDFLAFWEQHGGLSIFGYPVSAELWEDGRIVQYFERNRLALHPENPAESRVQLGMLGIERLQASGRSWRTLQQGRPGADPDCRFFSQTSHALCGEFRQFWERNGGAVIFGDPISEPAPEVSETDGRTYTVQYFENVRFELHPENTAPHTVLLGLLGSWRASWLLGPSRTASAFQAQITGPAQALAPLDQGILQINAGDYRGPAELRLFDSAGRLEHTASVELAGALVEVPWQAGGALGAHPAVLLIDGAVAGIAGSAYQLDAETQIATGLPRYDSLPGRIREFLSNDVSEYEYQGYT